jgi:hypothetical protein
MNELTEISTEDLRALFDVAVGSMNFASGFLDTDEVNMLRRVAGLIGVDPMEATPHEFRQQYPHAFKESRSLFASERLMCGWCNRESYNPLHADGANEAGHAANGPSVAVEARTASPEGSANHQGHSGPQEAVE